MYGIRESLLSQSLNDYAGHLSEGAYVLDCSMGSNPYGTPPLEVSPELLRDLSQYPPGDADLIECVRRRFADVLPITEGMIGFSCGSFGSCAALARMCLVPGKAAICMAPTFTAVTDDIATYEVDFKRVFLRAERGYAFDASDVVDSIEGNPGAFVYIDNPNNPTGQVFPLADVRRIVAAARAADSFVVLDEAYGDYMPDAQSALNLVVEFDNLAVTRTFSKGFGIAGARLGYCVAQPQVMNAFRKVNMPFSKNALAHAFAVQSMETGWAQRAKERIASDKPRLLAALADCKRLRVAKTDPGVPISMVYVEDGSVDLEQVFLRAGIRVVSCADYDGLGANAVRLNMHEDIDTLVRLIGKADALA